MISRRRKKSIFQLIPFNRINISKRQKFVIAVIILSCGLFFSEFLLGRSGFYIAFTLSFLSSFLLFWTNHKDIRENFTLSIFILPFFYSLAFALFYFLVPNRLLARIGITSLYAIGLYSLFLSQNIFTVASIRTIALLSSARTVSFVLTLVTYFFLSNIVFSLDLSIMFTSALLFIFTYFLTTHSIWTYTLNKSLFSEYFWVIVLSVCILELSLILWFWPSNPTIIALFLTGFFYTVIGLSHVWFEKRLFRGVMWEYIWVGVVVSLILILSTSWKG
ncbi:hypothetical protein C4559_04910 [Candidatus Microgenomates bacterium]|nr:MAG: hypothetical protein C4559_04910 [Candidatus Microgenomates bacterium]